MSSSSPVVADSTRDEEERSEDEASSQWIFPSLSNMLGSVPNPETFATSAILIYVNFINYMDRSILAGMTSYVKSDPDFHFGKANDKYLGFLQSAFVVGYMLTAPFFGYWGDRHSRKILVLIGISFWSFATLIGSFMTNYWLFLLFRGLVGIGEASYSTVAPAILSDLYSKDVRSRILALFYFGIPVGTGLGYMIGANIAGASGDWRWGMRLTPLLGFIAVVLIYFFMKDPPRGESEGVDMRGNSSTKKDIRSLIRNKSFIYLTCGFTCVTFCGGALMWWGPRFAYLGAKIACGDRIGCEKIQPDSISYRFGIVMTFAGIIGVPGGSFVSQLFRQRVENADPLVCGYTLLASVPILFFGLVSAQYDIFWCYGLTFIAGLLLNCNWSIVSDMTLYIVIPSRRSFASACQILMSHLLGDAFSPFIIGFMADAMQPSIRNNANAISSFFIQKSTYYTPSTYNDETADFISLQYALFSCCFFQVLGGLFFLYLSFYIVEDKAAASRESGISEGEEDEYGEGTPIIQRSRDSSEER